SSLILHPSSFPNNLPLQTGLFFGRKREQEQLLQRLVDPNYRLVTLVGAGGIGKTRLAIEVGKQVKMSFPDGVWFVPLAVVKGGAEQIKIAVGEAVGLGQGDKQMTGEQVLAILRDKQMLLIFDNSEPVLEEIAFIPEWLKRAPQISILATSREPLNFQAESVVGVGSLSVGSLPAGGLSTDTAEMGAAEALFAERGRMARDDFEVSAENLPQVRQICELVDGSPLGIGLAAAWVRRRSLTQIVEEIGRSLDILSTRLRDIDPRHRSMRAVFETSWQLLTAEEQGVLAGLSVFPGGVTAVAAAEVAGASLFVLDALCEKSLLQQQRESARYFMHSLVRQFAAEKLGDGETAVDHAFVDYFYQYAHDHQQTYEQLQPEWRNFLAGITKAHGLEAWQLVLDFVQVLDEPWFRQIRYNDMREGLTHALQAATALQDQPAFARILLRLGEVETELNNYAAAEAYLAEAINLLMQLEDSLGIAQAKYLLGRIKTDQAQNDEALALFLYARRIFEDEDDLSGVARCLNLIAFCYMKKQSDFQMARVHFEKSLAIQQNLPLSSTQVEALRLLARIKSNHGEYEAAENHLIEAAGLSKELNDVGEFAA
ncbi:MAG: tetratricopeptide repeat protein, partial [Methylococcales bacterium]|nr:tetratricopeptide repeat protein [Methylococcales bacterium]